MLIMPIDYVVLSEKSEKIFQMIIDKCLSHSRYNQAKDMDIRSSYNIRKDCMPIYPFFYNILMGETRVKVTIS